MGLEEMSVASESRLRCDIRAIHYKTGVHTRALQMAALREAL